jgi:hypothetical protein
MSPQGADAGMHLIADDVWGPLMGRNVFIRQINALYDSADWMSYTFSTGKGLQYGADVSTFTTRANQAGARVVLVDDVCADQILYGDAEHGMEKFQDVLAEVARRDGAEYVDFRRDLLERRDDFLFVDYTHLNEHGHALLAARLNQVLANTTRPNVERLAGIPDPQRN